MKAAKGTKRSIGRPRKAEADKVRSLGLSVPAELAPKIQAAADASRTTRSGFISAVLAAHFERESNGNSLTHLA